MVVTRGSLSSSTCCRSCCNVNAAGTSPRHARALCTLCPAQAIGGETDWRSSQSRTSAVSRVNKRPVTCDARPSSPSLVLRLACWLVLLQGPSCSDQELPEEEPKSLGHALQAFVVFPLRARIDVQRLVHQAACGGDARQAFVAWCVSIAQCATGSMLTGGGDVFWTQQLNLC